MKRIVILVSPHSNLGSIDNPRRGFDFVNQYLQQTGQPPMFEICIAGISRQVRLKSGLCTLHASHLFSEIKKADLVIIPAFDGSFEEATADFQPFANWILKQYQKGAEIASLCVGAFLLASTGLVDGKNCSTHWRAASAFRKMFPQVDLTTEKIMTDEYGIYTSGGAFSSANLVLHIIQKYAGREIAVACSKAFQIDPDREFQSPYIIFQGQKEHNDEQIKKAQEYIEENVHEKISVEELSQRFTLSRRNFERRFKKATDNTIVEYMQRVKVEAVKKQLESGAKTVNELMYQVGYSDLKSFRNIFKKYTGLSPTAYRGKFNAQPYHQLR